MDLSARLTAGTTRSTYTGILLMTVRKDHDGAEAMYRKAIELDPQHAMAHNSLGVLLTEVRKDYDGAEAMCRKGILLDRQAAILCYTLSEVLELRGTFAVQSTRWRHASARDGLVMTPRSV